MSVSDSALREHVALAIQAHQTVCGPDYQGMAAAALRAIDAWGDGVAAAQDTRLREIVREELARHDGGLAPESASSRWRSMDSAPFNKLVLVCFGGDALVVAYRVPDAPDSWVRFLAFGKSSWWPSIHSDYATAWTPLPPAPNDRNGAAA